MPADSLSRAMAEGLPVDTLEAVGVVATGLGHPRTVQFAPDGSLWFTDTETGSVYRVEDDEEAVLRMQRPGSFPYLAGFGADTALVFEPASHAMWRIGPAPGDTLEVPLGGRQPATGGLRYAAGNGTDWYVKIVGEEFDGYLARLNPITGMVTDSVALPGPSWRWAGLLRPDSAGVWSLAAFLPRVDRWLPGSPVDSLRLTGFDSPMLARTRQFLLGDTNAPPMLSASSAITSTSIYVLNMRPGWLHVDVFSLDGTLRQRLTQPDPGFNQDYYPTDLAVRELADGTLEIAVAILQPEPRIDLFRYRHVHPPAF